MERTNWSKDELIAYTLLYAANSNFQVDNHERNVIISKVDMQTFQKIHDEFENDNDYQSIEKITDSLQRHNYSEDDLNSLFSDIKLLYLSDGKFDAIEQSMFTYLKSKLS
jgi:hypothetical protein